MENGLFKKSRKHKQAEREKAAKEQEKGGERRGFFPAIVTKQQRGGLETAAGAGIPPYQDLQGRGAETAGGGT